VCDAVSACNHSACLHKSNAVFFFNCRLLIARIPTWFVPFGRLEVDQQTVGCGQIGLILIVASGELGPKGAERVRSRAILRRFVASSASAKTAAVASSKPGSSPMAPP